MKTRLLTLMLVWLAAVVPRLAHAHSQLRSTTNFESRTHLQNTLDHLTNNHIDMEDIAIGPNGQWIIVANNIIYNSSSISSSLISKVQQYIDTGRTIDAIAIGPNGSWVVAADDWFWRSSGVPSGATMETVVKDRQNNGHRIDELVILSNGWLMLSDGYFYAINVPEELFAALQDTEKSKREMRRVAIGDDGRWIALGEQWFASDGCGSTQRGHLETWQRSETRINHVALGINNDYIFFSHNTAVIKPPAPMRDLEYSLTNSSGATKNIWQEMNALGVPGVSLALIENGEVKYARGYGNLAGGGDRWVRAKTPFSMASLSKYISALVAMRKVKDGTLGFGRDARVMADQGTTNMSWWAGLGDEPMYYGTSLPYGLTLLRLLSHTAAMASDWGDMIPESEGKIDTLMILLGYGCSGTCNLATRTIWHDPALGSPSSAGYLYSNGGYEVVRGMLEDLTSQNFEDLAYQEVLDPLNMNNSTFEQPLPSSFSSRSAPPLDSSGNQLTRETYQWLAGGGLYASAEDYAKAMLVLINLADTHASGFLSSNETAEMLEDQNSSDGDLYGFGVTLNTSQVTATSGRFGHSGYIPDYSASKMLGSPELGVGLVVVTNSGNANGQKLICEIENAFRAQYGFSLNSC